MLSCAAEIPIDSKKTPTVLWGVALLKPLSVLLFSVVLACLWWSRQSYTWFGGGAASGPCEGKRPVWEELKDPGGKLGVFKEVLKAEGRAEVLPGFIPVLKNFEGEREELFQKEKCVLFLLQLLGKWWKFIQNLLERDKEIMCTCWQTKCFSIMALKAWVQIGVVRL